MSESNEPAFDPAPLEEFATPSQIGEILDAFVTHCDRALPELAAAVDERRIDAIERISHSLSGSAGTVGAPAVSRAARDLCSLARGDGATPGTDGREFDRAMDRLSEVTAQARAVIDRYAARLG